MTKRALSRPAAVAVLALLTSGAIAADPDPDGSMTDLPPLGGARIGVEVQPMTPELRRHFQAPPDRGLLVTRVDPDRPAQEAGLEVGDVILEAGGEAQRRPWDLVRVVGRAAEGEALPLVVVRKGKTRTLRVVPTGPAAPWPDPAGIAEWIERGMRMGSEELREKLRQLEERLEQLERQLEEQPKEGEAERTGAPRGTRAP